MENQEKAHSDTRISVIGLGYVGLCTAVTFASKNFQVIGLDADLEKITMIKQKKAPIYEDGLEELLKESIENKKLSCTQDYDYAIRNSDLSIIAVGTPIQPNGCVNYEYLRSASVSIGKALKFKQDYHLVVVKSTVLPGTTENEVRPLIEKNAERKCGSTFDICYNPEFLREGSAIADVFDTDRIVIGETTVRAGNFLEEVYRVFYCNRLPPIVRTNIATAELIKHANNAFLATKISYINSIANVCQSIPGADVMVVAKALGLDRRINSSFLRAGIGYGGSCLPKDVKALSTFSENIGANPLLINAVQNVNRLQPLRVVELAQEVLGKLQNKSIAVLGLAFKPDTDDVRDSVSIDVVKAFLDKRAIVTVYDPFALENAKCILKNRVKYASSAIECLRNADCCVIATEWSEFRRLGWKDFVDQMRNPVLIDGRRIYNYKDFAGHLRFEAIGLGSQISRGDSEFNENKRTLTNNREGANVI